MTVFGDPARIIASQNLIHAFLDFLERIEISASSGRITPFAVFLDFVRIPGTCAYTFNEFGAQIEERGLMGLPGRLVPAPGRSDKAALNQFVILFADEPNFRYSQ